MHHVKYAQSAAVNPHGPENHESRSWTAWERRGGIQQQQNCQVLVPGGQQTTVNLMEIRGDRLPLYGNNVHDK